MSKRTQFFVGSTIVSGVCLVAYCLAAEAHVVPSSAYLVAVLLALFASTLKVHLPGITGTISVNFLFILIAIAVFTFSETVLLASVACMVQCLWRPRSRPRPVQVSFNVATLAISSGASYRISHLLAGSPAPHLGVLLAVAASFYFTADTLLVSGVLSLVQGKSLFAVWQQCYLWSFPYYLAGAAIAGLAVETDRALGWVMSLLILPVMYLVYVFYRICVERLARASIAVAP
ncbi:MAG: hypothetical protein LAQ69_27930 [Acidobacteriia bacterium]|nr:hypothetical protein [Terriglobia bacterium]